MKVTLEFFTSLCNDTGHLLGLYDYQAMSTGRAFEIDNIECSIYFNETKGTARLICELGDPKEGLELEVYRQLLEIQSFIADQIDAMFVRDPLGDRLLFSARLPLHEKMPAQNLATALKTLVGQVRLWRDTTLAGQFIDYEQELDDFIASKGRFIVQPA